MNNMGISTDPALLDVQLPSTLIESPSVSTFLPEEEASICPLLSTTNGTSTPLAFSHPLTPSADSNNSVNCEDTKAETSSSSGSSSGIGIDVTDTAATTLFSKHAYQHLRKNEEKSQDNNEHGLNGSMNHKLNKDTPSFVSWNWPLIRKCTFFVFMSSLLAMCSIVVAMIVTLPKTCNPKTAWYRGSVFYEIFPSSFQDSNNDGVGDIRGIVNRVDYFTSMGIGAVRLNSIFPSEHYPDDFDNVTSLMEIATVLGNINDLHLLSHSLHMHNISLILDLPIFPFLNRLDDTNYIKTNVLASFEENVSLSTSTLKSTAAPSTVNPDNMVSNAIRKWMSVGVDGFYIKGLENFHADRNLIGNLAEWKHIIGPNRVLITSESVFDQIDDAKRSELLYHIDLVDIFLDVWNGTKHMEERIKSVLSGIFAPTDNGVWVQWSIGGVGKQRITRRMENGNATLAATIMQLMLPGTPNIFYGDEIDLENANDPHNEHTETKHLHHLTTMQWSNTSITFTNRETLPWLPQSASSSFENFDQISKMIYLRDRSPSIYKNVICKAGQNVSNTQVRHNQNDILVVERVYPRRNTFVSVSNFGQKRVNMDMTAMYYSGRVMLGKTLTEKIYFGDFEIGPLQTFVVKLDK